MAVARKKKATAKRKPAKRKVAKKKPAKRKVAKRKPAKRKVAKRKPAKRKVAKRKPAKRKVAKRKPAARKKATSRGKPAARKAAPRKKAKTKRKPNAAFMRPVSLSDALGEVVGHKDIPRTEVTKRLWLYIKKYKLQDNVNRRMINADSKLLRVFGGRKKVNMFEMTKLVSKHMK